LLTLFLKNKHNTYCIIETGIGWWKIHGFIRLRNWDDKSWIAELLEKFNFKLLKFSYEEMNDIIERFTNKLVLVKDHDRFCLGVVQH
jgi:hypothetical protein